MFFIHSTPPLIGQTAPSPGSRAPLFENLIYVNIYIFLLPASLNNSNDVVESFHNLYNV
jgi:hypothetical protein